MLAIKAMKMIHPLAMASALAIFLVASDSSLAATTVLHFSVSDTDEATVVAGTVAGTDGSPDGTVASGILELSADVPIEGVPAGSGNRSLAFTNSQVITIPGTQQLSHANAIAAGGFTFETWFKWDGGGTLNAMIDYAGTEKFRIQTATGALDINFDQGSGLQVLAMPTANEWHYIAAVFEHDGEPVDADLKIYGTLTWYFDSNEPVSTVNVTKDDFGDSLNRTIGVGGHPLGFGADFHNGLMFEPRVSLGALTVAELLFGGQAPEEFRILSINYDENPEDPSVTFSWVSSPSARYRTEYSLDLIEWLEIDDDVASSGDLTEFTHHFLPGHSELVGSQRVYYRVAPVASN
ncbi:MAG: hypothetical protein ACI9NC_001288 [Verrucomicrobiales bacterium]